MSLLLVARLTTFGSNQMLSLQRTYRFGEKAIDKLRCVLLFVEKSGAEKQQLVAGLRAEEAQSTLQGPGGPAALPNADGSAGTISPLQPYRIQNALMPEQFLFAPDGMNFDNVVQ
jgi:hypothetical protein